MFNKYISFSKLSYQPLQNVYIFFGHSVYHTGPVSWSKSLLGKHSCLSVGSGILHREQRKHQHGVLEKLQQPSMARLKRTTEQGDRQEQNQLNG